ncbi:MAG: ribosomal protein S18-alanine N-acetyltransferase [Dehalococcoidia bacterium]|nr:ribosomal protein S18-alanine N-acetyltransferase [Dehalococcoidia bacterium]
MTSEDILGPIAIEPMREEDIPQILEIEREAFSLAWSEGAYRRELRWNRLARYLVLRDKSEVAPESLEPMVEREGSLGSRILSFLKRSPTQASTNSLVIGYSGQWLMVDESHLITIAVREKLRRHGLGEALLIASIDKAIELGARIMTLEVRASNLSAQTMYEKFGFRKVGLRPHYYTDNNEDAIIMASDVLTSAAFQGRIQQSKAEIRGKVDIQWLP